MTYGVRLDKALQTAGKDRKELADALEISVQSVGQVITGVTKAFTAENNARAARFLRVDPYWLATGEGEPRPKGTGWPFLSFGPADYYALDEALRMEAEDRLAGAILRMKGLTLSKERS